MLSLSEIAAGVLLPAATTAVLLLLGWRVLRHRRSARESRSWIGPLAVGAGFVAGYLALFGGVPLPPHDAVDWLVWLALPLAALGLADSFLRLPPPGRVLSIALAVTAVFLLLAWPRLNGAAGQGVASLLLAASLVAVIVWVAFDAFAARSSAGRVSLILLAVALPAAIALGCSGSIRYALIAVILAATQAGTLTAAILLGHAALARGVVVVWGSLLGGLLLCGVLYAELSPTSALLLAIAPNMAWLCRGGPRRFGWLAHLVLQVLLVAAIAALAAVLAWQHTSAAS